MLWFRQPTQKPKQLGSGNYKTLCDQASRREAPISEKRRLDSTIYSVAVARGLPPLENTGFPPTSCQLVRACDGHYLGPLLVMGTLVVVIPLGGISETSNSRHWISDLVLRD